MSESFDYLGVVLDTKWKWKMHCLFHKIGNCLSVFNPIFHMLDEECLTASFNDLFLPHLDYADIARGHQPDLTTGMKQYVAIIPKSHCKENCKAKSDIRYDPNIVAWVPLHARSFHLCPEMQAMTKMADLTKFRQTDFGQIDDFHANYIT